MSEAGFEPAIVAVAQFQTVVPRTARPLQSAYQLSYTLLPYTHSIMCGLCSHSLHLPKFNKGYLRVLYEWHRFSESFTVDRVPEGMETSAVDLATLLDAGDGAVVTLVAGETRLAAHRAVLTARSPVLAAMLQEAGGGHISVPGVEGAVLRQLLAYLYTLRAPQLPALAPHLLAAADRYGLSALKAECEQQVATQLSVETAAATAVLAMRHNSDSLRRDAVAFVKAHLPRVMATRGWADAVADHPQSVAELTRLVSQPPTETRSLSAEEKGRRLIEAAKQGTVEELEELLAVGTDVGTGDNIRSTALHWAANRGHTKAVRSLVEAGAVVDARNYWQKTPLHYAAQNGHTAVVEVLVASSADPNIRDDDGWTPLHDAAYYGHAEVVTTLLEAGANRRATDDWGRTPLDVARQYNHHQLTGMLI
ncbi:poly [ADP-ribose] polymerase tankyrase-2-like isoform X4 [Schistocerca piceifrons]|uniref:poly [ADP-ribose] polymerase tankyrase-2-like isoform X4 n=1 Tax=Schistocerca piceifrons TaxID=274613 RepID=UPI001F5FB38D|nr:poly [ADP-ribose] polymerase tankyrase-2-like isoform X4 [Schistocerca piceifrons]